MSELENKIREYREYKRMIEEAEEIADASADEIKAAMRAVGKDKLIVGEYKLTYCDATRSTLDRQSLEADFGDLSKYTKISTYKQFRVS